MRIFVEFENVRHHHEIDAVGGERQFAQVAQYIDRPRFAGDLALVFRARSVCLAGGLTGHLLQHLRDGAFMRRFLDKGVLFGTLRQVPVHALEHGDLGLVGAAAWLAAQPRA